MVVVGRGSKWKGVDEGLGYSIYQLNLKTDVWLSSAMFVILFSCLRSAYFWI